LDTLRTRLRKRRKREKARRAAKEFAARRAFFFAFFGLGAGGLHRVRTPHGGHGSVPAQIKNPSVVKETRAT